MLQASAGAELLELICVPWSSLGSCPRIANWNGDEKNERREMVDWEWGKDGKDLPTVLLEMSQEFLRTGWPWSSFPIGIHSLSPVPTMPFHSLIMTPLRARSHLSHALAAHRIFILNIFFFKWIFLFQHHSQGTFIILNLIPTPEKPHPAWPCRRETSRRWKFWCPEWFG